MICTYDRAYGLGKYRSGAGVDSRVLPVIRSVVFESHLRSLRVLPFLRLRVRCHSNLQLDTQSSRVPPLRVRFRPNPCWDSSRGCPARVGPCPPGGGTQGDRWGRIRRYPVQIASSIVVFFVSLIIMIMLLALNEGAQQLYYNQVPYNTTGVGFPGFRGFSPAFRVWGFRCFNVSTFTE